jgi:hypothetical protein
LPKIQGREDAENAGGVAAKAEIRGPQGGARDRQVGGGWIGGILEYVGTSDVAVGSEKQATTTELIVVSGRRNKRN